MGLASIDLLIFDAHELYALLVDCPITWFLILAPLLTSPVGFFEDPPLEFCPADPRLELLTIGLVVPLQFSGSMWVLFALFLCLNCPEKASSLLLLVHVYKAMGSSSPSPACFFSPVLVDIGFSSIVPSMSFSV